jgi:putative membrane protein
VGSEPARGGRDLGGDEARAIEVADATRRTLLASERTELAWWRTGLTALAVALGVGRVVPELNRSALRWPYVIAGVGFALWGILALGYGSARRATVDRVLEHGRFPDPPRWALRVLAGGGIALGVLTAVLILLD